MDTFNQFVFDNWLLFVVVFGILIGLTEGIKYVMNFSRESARLQAENELKRQMIQRGMSPDEIVRVLHGTAPTRTEAKVTRETNHLAELGKSLAVQGVSSPILEAILTHFANIPERYQPSVFESIKEMIDESVEEAPLLAAVSAFAKAYQAKEKHDINSEVPF